MCVCVCVCGDRDTDIWHDIMIIIMPDNDMR